jgi:hypothetical protein
MHVLSQIVSTMKVTMVMVSDSVCSGSQFICQSLYIFFHIKKYVLEDSDKILREMTSSFSFVEHITVRIIMV